MPAAFDHAPKCTFMGVEGVSYQRRKFSLSIGHVDISIILVVDILLFNDDVLFWLIVSSLDILAHKTSFFASLILGIFL